MARFLDSLPYGRVCTVQVGVRRSFQNVQPAAFLRLRYGRDLAKVFGDSALSQPWLLMVVEGLRLFPFALLATKELWGKQYLNVMILRDVS
jgi:hypothetical protein